MTNQPRLELVHPNPAAQALAMSTLTGADALSNAAKTAETARTALQDRTNAILAARLAGHTTHDIAAATGLDAD